ncbi:MAG: hypothetical protein E6Q39_00560 [Crocinitomicaceae bacterium]|nr:MAG: hypothetical protein E6Q39_00560 [Crocinitomicaceae bacterium]
MSAPFTQNSGHARCRSGEIRGASWSEIDLGSKLWVISANRMKMAQEHRVPLSASAIDLLTSLPRLEGNPTNKNELFGERFLRSLESSRARLEEMNEHYRQLSVLYSQRDDPFEGKTKPGDWRPDGAELCPVCNGNGKGTDQRICGKCSGRGFIRR